jgi:hypothetical protein
MRLQNSLLAAWQHVRQTTAASHRR